MPKPGKIRKGVRSVLGGLRRTSQKLSEFMPSSPKPKPKFNRPLTKLERARQRVKAQERRIQARIDRAG